MKRFLSALALGAVLVTVAGGCGQTAPSGDAKGKEKERTVAKGGNEKTDPGHDHSGWWCDEHGLPEEVCDLCSKKFREAEKAKGNWCEHNRVKSSCFKCNPTLRAKYAAEYKAKNGGKEPPPTEDDEKEGKGKDKK